MENQDPKPTIFVPRGSAFYVPDSVRAERLGAPVAEQEPDPEREPRGIPAKRRSSRKSGSRPEPRKASRPRFQPEPPKTPRKPPDKPWFAPVLEEEEGPDGPDESLTVPPEILALAEEAATRWDMKVSAMQLAATKPEKGWGAIWRIETNKGPRSLKLLHRPFERNLFSIYAQQYLVEQKFRVAPLVPTREGDLYTITQDRMFIVTDWIEGLHPATKVTPDGAAALCYGLGEFHRHSQGYQPPPEAYHASRLHRWPGVYRKMRTKIDWFEHLARAYPEMPASPLLLEVLPRFRQQADDAITLLEGSAYPDLTARGDQAWGLVHQGE